jgi:hypothetical protein
MAQANTDTAVDVVVVGSGPNGLLSPPLSYSSSFQCGRLNSRANLALSDEPSS